MASHTHALPAGAELQTAARAAIERAGEQWTDLRAEVFTALAELPRPASAYDVAEAVSRRLDRRVAANTVYRILDLFVSTNLAMRVESRNAYLANAHPGCVHDCIFLVCDDCGGATHIDDDPLTGAVRAAAAATGFAPSRPVVEVRGRCSDCRS